MAGSYFVEKLTNDMEEEAVEYIRKIDELGGMLEAVEHGYIQREVARAAWRYQKDVESGQQVIVGVNKYVDEKEPRIDLLKITPGDGGRAERAHRPAQGEAGQAKMEEALEKLREAAERGREPLRADDGRGRGVRDPRGSLGRVPRSLRHVQGILTALRLSLNSNRGQTP